jgi:ATP-dependent DNA helicase RecQ
MQQNITYLLQQYWGYSSFKPQQQQIIEAVLAGNNLLAIMPTGGGKSLCFQVPAMAMPGVCLVVSPLVALIKDQISNLKSKGIPALAIHAGMSYLDIKRDLENLVNGSYFKFLYVSPERLQSSLFLEYLPAIPINLVAIDEAHCISQWGYDFRPAYLQIAAIKEQIAEDIPFIALTASATQQVQQDIIMQLALPSSTQIYRQSFARPQLSYSLFNETNKQHRLFKIINSLKGSGIVYCRTRKQTQVVCNLLTEQGANADFYHAGLPKEARNEKQNNWIQNKTRIIVCTNAFGMGIDKPDVRFVVHYQAPDCLENYYQEAGRAGRDGKKAYAILLTTDTEIADLKAQIIHKFPPKEFLRQLYFAIMNYLNIAEDTGEGKLCSFDVVAFAKAFKFEVPNVLNGLKILEQEALLVYAQENHKPSSVAFTASKETLFDLKITHPNLAETATALLRCYGGIFDYETYINEKHLANFASTPITTILANLKQLHQQGILVYKPQNNSPTIYITTNRCFAESPVVNYQAILERKEVYKKTLTEYLKFLSTTSICRSKFIGNYFGDADIPSCGICDNCLAIKSIVTPTDIKTIGLAITNLLQNQTTPIYFNNVATLLPQYPQQKVILTLNFLLAEDEISIDEAGILTK